MIERALDSPGRDWEPQNPEIEAAVPDAREATSAIDEILILQIDSLIAERDGKKSATK